MPLVQWIWHNISQLSHTGLPLFTSLNISVAARTSVGLGPASDPVAVTTAEGGKFKCVDCHVLKFFSTRDIAYSLYNSSGNHPLKRPPLVAIFLVEDKAVLYL